MTTEKMTVHKALAELKIIDDRIQKAVYNSDKPFVAAYKNGADKINGIAINDYSDAMKSNYQKVTDLIKRRNAMKRAVVLSNATTKVKIGDAEYTVAEAIEMKNHGMDGMKLLLHELTSQLNVTNRVLNENSGENLEEKAEQYVLSVLRAQGESADKVDTKQIQALRESYIENNAFEMLDPIGITGKIEEFDKMITEFETEVDSCLSVSNALTIIEFEY